MKTQLQKQVDDFNQKYKVGDKVKIRLDNGRIKTVTIRFPASIFSGHTAVGWFNQISGCYELNRVINGK